MAVLGAKLEQSKMVRILGLQRAHQNIKRRKLAQVFEVRVFQEKRPACETATDTSLQPLKRSFTALQHCKYAGDLIVAVVRMPKGFWARTSRRHTVQRLAR